MKAIASATDASEDGDGLFEVDCDGSYGDLVIGLGGSTLLQAETSPHLPSRGSSHILCTSYPLHL